MHLFLDEITRRDEGSRKPVLDRVSLHARPGEIVCVAGPAGAGKSALLRFVGERADGVDGVRMGTDDEREPGAARPALVRGWRSGGAPAPRWRGEEWRGVSIRRYAFPGTALDGCGLPDLLLVDDPRGHPAFADAAARRAFVRDLRGLHARPERRTVICATRDGDDALALADRIAVLDGGRVAQSGTPADVRDRPANEFVARLFGRPPINLVPAILEKDGQALLVGNRTVSLAGRIAEEFCRDVTVGVRPPHARLDRAGAGWRGRVVSREPYEARWLVTVATEGVRLRALADEPYEPEEMVVVRIPPERFVVFDDRGVRLEQS